MNKIVQKLPPCARGGSGGVCSPIFAIAKRVQTCGSNWTSDWKGLGVERPRGPTDIEGGSDVNENVTFCSLKAKQSLARASEIAACDVTLRSDLAIPSPKGAGPRLPEPISEVISHSSWVIRGGSGEEKDRWGRPVLWLYHCNNVTLARDLASVDVNETFIGGQEFVLGER